MKIRYVGAGLVAWLVASVCAAAMDVTGIGGVGYTNSTGGVNGYATAGAVMASFDGTGFKSELSGGYTRSAYEGLSLDVTNVTADFFFKDKAGEIGASLGYHRLTAGVRVSGFTVSGDANATSYGGFGEWYANRFLSLRVKGGAYSGDADGGYAGAGLGIYLGRNFVWSSEYNYVSMNGLGHMSTIETGIEVMPYQSVPVSLAVQYGRSWVGGGSSASNTIGVALKFRVGGPDLDLRSWDRAGPTQWNGALSL